MQPDELAAVADVVAQAIQEALAPLLERVAVIEARLDGLSGNEAAIGLLRERVAIVETKATMVPTALGEVEAIDLTPVLERMAAAEARLDVLGELRDQVVVLETKAATPAAPDPDIGALRDRVFAVETRTEATLDAFRADLTAIERTTTKDAMRLEGYTSMLQRDASALGERLAVVETRPLLPGPAGADGAKGLDGKDGADGAPGTAGLAFEGVYQDGKSYQPGHLVTWAGSSWHCNERTTTKPGDGSKAWTLMVKRGRDGRDGVDAPGALPVVSLGRRE